MARAVEWAVLAVAATLLVGCGGGKIRNSSDDGTRGDAGSDRDAYAPDTEGPRINDRNVAILPLGDSITGEPRTYRRELYPALVAHGCVVDYVGSARDQYAMIPDGDHEGHPGFNTADVLRDLSEFLAAGEFSGSFASAKRAPDVVLMMIGTNNFAWNGCHEDGAPTALDQNMTIVDRLLEAFPNTRIFDASIVPMGVDAAHAQRCFGAAAEYNEGLERRVRERASDGESIRFVDLNASVTPADLRDTVHPYDATDPAAPAGHIGYRKIASAWFVALSANLSCLSGTTCTDGKKDGDETGPDCGGKCVACP